MKSMTKYFLMVTALAGATGLAAVGCGDSGDDTGVDGGGVDGSSSDAKPIVDGTKLWALKSGDYTVLTASMVTDGCMIGVDKQMSAGGLIGVSLPLTVDNKTGEVTIGNSLGTPPIPSLGKGNIQANMATLTGETMISADAPSKCTFKRTVTGTLKMTADYMFTLTMTRADSNQMMCTETPCTSTWTWTMGPKN